MENITFRKALKEDCPKILEFILAIARYEKLDDTVVTSVEDLEYALFDIKIGNVIFLLKDNKEIGFALYYYNFSTFTGKCGMHLEDFFIYEEERHKGYGKLLFKEVVKKVKEEGCPRLERTCLNWNKPSIKFYEMMGAKPLDEWTTFRLLNQDFDDALTK